MKNHITKLVAVFMAVLMMLSLVPAAALSDFNLPELLSVFGGTSATDNADGTSGDDATTESAIPTEDGTPVMQAGGEGLYMAADGTLYMDTDGDGTAEAISGDSIADEDFGMTVTQGKVTNDETYYALGTDAITGITADTNLDIEQVKQISPYEPSSQSGNENDPFLPGGDAWINLSKVFYGAPAMPSYPITKWSANTSVYNVTGSALADVDLIDATVWATAHKTTDTAVTLKHSNGSDLLIPFATKADAKKSGASTAYVYNRYDAMQGKWGVTLDKNVKTMTWVASGTRPVGNKTPNNTILYLTDTPYLYYSTEALDGTQMAISLLIGTPVQKEIGASNDDNKGQTQVSDTTEFEYRWYTITDNAERPGISTDTLDNSMTPNVTISDVVATVSGRKVGGVAQYGAAEQQVADVKAAIAANNATDPIALVAEDKREALYVDGSITGCIDFANILPMVMESLKNVDGEEKGREDVQYKIAQVRVDTKTAAGATDSAARINYLYFGPGQSTVYTPQTTNGSEVNGFAWMYAQDSSKSNTEANTNLSGFVSDYKTNTTTERAYTSGWENGETVTITNTPNNPQTITVDTHGKYGGELIAKDLIDRDADTGLYEASYEQAFLDGKSMIWQFVDENGQVQRLEAEYNQDAKSYYVMVTIPIRKWVNVLGNSRRLSMVVTVEQGADATNGGEFYPSLAFWGNASGSHGAGHAKNTFGGRFRNEDLLAMFGQDNSYYHVDTSQNYFMMEIDSTLGHSTIYNTQLVEDGYVVYSYRGTNYFVKDNKVFTRKQNTNAAGYLEYKSLTGDTYYYDAANKVLYNTSGIASDIDVNSLAAQYTYSAADLGTVFGLTSQNKTVDGYALYTDANGTEYYKDSNNVYYTREHTRNSWGSFLYIGSDSTTKYTNDPDTGKWYDADGHEIDTAPTDVTAHYTYTMALLEKEYNDTESWYDILRSPYMYDKTVQAAKKSCNITDDLIGYVYISSLRFAMPVGSKITVQNMKGDGNSAGLNMYSTSGAIVSAYDGGTGSQPVTNVENELPEMEATLKAGASTDPAVETHDYTESGTIKGTQTDSAAGYGPYLEDSYYTIYDLLDMEQVNGHGDYASTDNAAINPIYGTNLRFTEWVPIYSGPSTTGTERYGTIRQDRDVVLYASINDNSGKRWGLTGVMTKGGTAEWGWFDMTNGGIGGNWWQTGEAGGRNKANPFIDLSSEKYGGKTVEDYPNYDSIKSAVINHLGANWHLSSFNTGGDIHFTNGENDYAKENYAITADDIYDADGYYQRTMLAFGNYNRDAGHYSATHAADQNWLVTDDSTELELRSKTVNGGQFYGFGMSRTLKEPIRLHRGGTQNGYPVLYYDLGVENAGGHFTLALSIVKKSARYQEVNGNAVELKDKAKYEDTMLLYLDGNNGLLKTEGLGTYADGTGYISLENLLTVNQEYWTGNYDTGEGGADNPDDPSYAVLDEPNKAPRYVYEIVGVSVYVQRKEYNPGTINLNRLEILQEDTPWLDKMAVKDKSTSNDYSQKVKLVDSMNIINDVFYHKHDEETDGQYTVDSSGNITNTTYKSTTTKLGSHIKENSNSGWSGQVTIDYDNDQSWWNDRETELFNGAKAESVDGVYEYRTALGHLRVWVPAHREASFILTADRSFNTQNYKYLYYSYSVRNVDTGISEQETTTNNGRTKDGKDVTGIEVAIKSTQTASQQAYLEQNGTWVYYDASNDFFGSDVPDDRSYDTMMNAALDLSSLDHIDSINQIVFYMNNEESKTAEFYINYVYLSNQEPTQLIQNSLAKPQMQYYYLMDNTGDRYSARFPTLDNPTGAVNGTTVDNGRNNPVIVERGALLSDGTYFNGEPLDGYGTATSAADSKGYYKKTYSDAALKNIWFYSGVTLGTDGKENTKDYTDITDFYTYKERNGDGIDDIYDMMWSYGRWYTGVGDSMMNTMYVEGEDKAVTGNLTLRYATEDYVLLRAGIQPIKYTTYYNAMGGQFRYENSNSTIQGGVQVDENSYYITSTVLFSNFTYPVTGPDVITPFKYGYEFKGWLTEDDLFGEEDTTEKNLYKYHRKEVPGVNYFYAKWEKTLDSTHTNTAQFYINDGTERVWFTRVAKYETKENESFKITIPDIKQYEDAEGVTQFIRGWKVKGTAGNTALYKPGQKVVLTKNVNLEPVLATNTTQNLSMTVTLNGAKLFLVTDMKDGKYTELKDLSNGYQGITCTKSKSGMTYTYYNLPQDVIVVAKPINVDTTGKSVWMLTKDTTNSDYASTSRSAHYLNGTTGTVMSTNSTEYQFSVYATMTLTYTALDTGSKADYQTEHGVVSTMVSSTSEAAEGGREMIFVSSFDLSNAPNAKAVAWGTLYTKNNLYKTIDMSEDMTLKTESIDAASIDEGSFETKHANVRQVKATSKSVTNQYYLRVTENKGNRVQYFCRSYVIYQIGDSPTYYVAYSNVVLKEYLAEAN